MIRRVGISLALLLTTLISTMPHTAAAESTYPGSGKRVVYSRSAHQVWLINADETLSATWKVTGNPAIPAVGTYHVYSRSPVTHTIDGKYTFTQMVRFARSVRGIGIGFHALPYDSVTKAWIMPPSKIGEPGYKSSGCVRQSLDNAKRMWSWATIGTQVIVLK